MNINEYRFSKCSITLFDKTYLISEVQSKTQAKPSERSVDVIQVEDDDKGSHSVDNRSQNVESHTNPSIDNPNVIVRSRIDIRELDHSLQELFAVSKSTNSCCSDNSL